LYDTIPYLWTFKKLKAEVCPDLKLLIGMPSPYRNKMYEFNIDLLKLFGVWDDCLLVTDSIKYERVFVGSSPTHGGASNEPPSQHVYDLYNELTNWVVKQGGGDSLPTPRKIYVSRRTWMHHNLSNIGTNYTTRRKFMNEDAFVEALKEKGYVEVFCENMTMAEKIRLFYNATHVVGCIGGGMCNLLFSRPDTKAYCIVSPYFMDINTRFKYSMDHTDITYIWDTEVLRDPGRHPLYVRVRVVDPKSPYHDRIGEIVSSSSSVGDGDDGLYNVQLSKNDVPGFNSAIDFEIVELRPDSFVLLDKGLNSPFQLHMMAGSLKIS
jgi:capsular polysaccharide biosynthesis protein